MREDYTGHEKDATGLHYAGARYYLSAFGRWNATDPHADLYPELTSYNYAFNNPLSWADPTGKDPCDTDGDGVVDAECMPELIVTAERESIQESGYHPFRANALTRFAMNHLGYEPYRHPGEGGPAAVLEQEPATGQWWVFPSSTEQVGPSVSESDFLFVPGAVITQPGKMFAKAGIKTTQHFRDNLVKRASRGITEVKALRTYRHGRLFYDPRSGNYVRYDSKTGIAVVTDKKAGGEAVTVFEQSKPTSAWVHVKWRPGQ